MNVRSLVHLDSCKSTLNAQRKSSYIKEMIMHRQLIYKSGSISHGKILDATGRESVPKGQTMMADSIFEVPEA